MSVPENELNAIQEELRWISLEEIARLQEPPSKWTVFDVLVPAGCIATTGILGNGIYQMFKQNSRKQQKMMRYRVLAQGVTIFLAIAGVFQHKFKGP